MTLSLAAILAESARRYPERDAVVLGPSRITYARLWEETRRYAAVLREQGVGPGGRVAVLLPNVPDFPRVYYAVLSLGAVVVPVHALLVAREIGYVLTDSAATMIVAGGPLIPQALQAAQQAGVPLLTVLAPPAAEGEKEAGEKEVGERPLALDRAAAQATPIDSYTERAATDEAVILYTSGTTGAPKGAVLTQLNMTMNATVSANSVIDLTPDDVILGCLPLFHSFGQTCAMNAGFSAGATLVLLPRFDPAAALDLLVTERVTVFEGVPTMYIGLLAAARADDRRPTLRRAISGGASLPMTVIERFAETFGADIYEGYGLSETSPVATFNQQVFGRKPGTVGCGIWGVQAAVAAAEVEGRIDLLPLGEIGEIVIRGHNVFAGYLNNPAATAEVLVDGWFRTGDLGTQDADGFITIVDRKKDLILRGGFNVYPREVEEVLAGHPGVAQVAVLGVSDAVQGEEVCAVVVRTADAGALTEVELIAWAREQMGRHKYPRRVEFVEQMPLGPSGKVLKRELAKGL
ncbi:long-chain fatty acid--CoA ligase [Nakamurella flavida]|uniref:Long-chain fatty acid--CoA ligase n=1 Tax=Nakamurella flavida TaxID=363630 RepID=A0A938YDG6_9ACTN|nr:long-chain fatty acid--CoA ligase [Nakamurella flavida]MBM9475655.1 long-chain fatty acid--CoA ligase [Nakamurella flavida]MDP9778069.1 long-chain acyl-CoA synthetase [Nakamurella flavida]